MVEKAFKNKPDLIASVLTTLFVLGLVLYSLIWAASGIAATAGLGRLPRLPKRLQHLIWHWLLGERNDANGV